MENDKSPNLDGIRINLYKELYQLLENNFLQLYKNNELNHNYFNT